MLPDRCRQIRAAALMVFAATLSAGCAAVRERPISYVPQESVLPIKEADAIPVEVKVEDLQAAPSAAYWSYWSPRYLFEPEDHYFRVKDPVGTITSAAETELKARGFKIGGGGASITIQLLYFEATFEQDPWGRATVRAYLSMRVQVRPQTGKVLYSKVVGGEASPISGALMWHPATHELEQSLADAVKRLFSDPEFTAAILATRQQPPAKPVSPGRIAGAFATMSRR